MPLTQTQRLINTYGASLKNGTVSNEELIILLDPSTFTKSEGYVDPMRLFQTPIIVKWMQ
ncbi:hypothetical protein N749_05280 [Legionella pneumophila str. Leg01/20]|nr:hypothetical protein N749_05280 [Legionella pneumophila str. Leg01/20]